MGVLRTVGVALALGLGLGLGLGLAAASAVPGMATAAGGHPSGLTYAALGDSYASGLGLPPYTNQPATGCFQSAANYAHTVASEWELQLSDASCSGAVAANIVRAPQETGEGTAPPQSTALSSDTDVVTVSIGGNDLGFAAIAEYCTALSAEGPITGDLQLDDCRSHFHPDAGTDLLQQRLTEVVEPAVHSALGGIAAAAPHAVVIVVGYPAITPDAAHTPAGGCFRSAVKAGSDSGRFAENAFPFTDADVPYLHGVEAGLSAMLKRQAEAAGALYIDAFDASQAHSACAAASEAYVNGITLRDLGGSTATPAPVPGSGAGAPAEFDVERGALHPNTAGVAFLATQVQTAMKAAFPAPTPTVSTPGPSPAADARSEWTLPLTFSPGTVIGIMVVLVATGAVVTVLWRRRQQEQDDMARDGESGSDRR
ncbi:SGNH/GDSL hydrolase family protein [Cryobacterium tepidiphilum]|uniref:SGNH/GDSL hydrolase family protein n=1 Tax=Cryobacterium tepidiphilum TaxID=2486026 RepID=A0A3M8L9T3_9MICO|nr:SGNH/GDSL hydrolase family protein [Cryobacterium tepidiphilum]RNE62263.1 SGNH/GDSL hydrolase family protein [Cryobacterium tepidiphilum]